jgi:hypothetical protein
MKKSKQSSPKTSVVGKNKTKALKEQLLEVQVSLLQKKLNDRECFIEMPIDACMSIYREKRGDAVDKVAKKVLIRFLSLYV